MYHAVMAPFATQLLFSRMTSAGKRVMFNDTVATGKDLMMSELVCNHELHPNMPYLSTNTACPLVLELPIALTTKSVSV